MNLARLLSATARVHAGRTALLDAEFTLTWALWFERMRRVAGVLAAAGAGPGARYGLLMKNGFRQAEAIWAGHWGGAVPVPVNWRLAPREVADILSDAGCALVLVDPEFEALLEEPPLDAWRARAIVAGADRGDYEARLSAAALAPMHDCAEDAEAIVLYTGGTTGRSKGVRLSHRNLAWNAMQVGLALGIRQDDVTLTVAPMFHAAALCSNVTTLLGGTHAYLRQFSPQAMLEAVERWRVRYTTVVPTMLKMVLDDPQAARFDRSSLRVVFYGSSPMPVSWMRAAIGFLPNATFYQAYGLTETSSHASVLRPEDHLRVPGSIGRSLPGVALRVVDDAGHDVAAGGVGEILVRGPNVMSGYWQRPQETAAVLRDGWLHTGDLARIDANGYLFIVDRMKDMVISGGVNLYPRESENVLAAHPAVADVAVFGVPDPHWGEALAAAVVLRPGHEADAQALLSFARTRLGSFKLPKRVHFVDQLPKTASGKVRKADLRAQFIASTHP